MIGNDMSEILYIIVPVTLDENFRDLYYLATGEEVQSNPPMNKNKTHYIIGSSRISSRKKEILEKLLPGATYQLKSERYEQIPDDISDIDKEVIQIRNQQKDDEFKY